MVGPFSFTSVLSSDRPSPAPEALHVPGRRSKPCARPLPHPPDHGGDGCGYQACSSHVQIPHPAFTVAKLRAMAVAFNPLPCAPCAHLAQGRRLQPRKAVTSISTFISGSFSPATIIVAAGRTSPSASRSAGAISARRRDVGDRVVDPHHVGHREARLRQRPGDGGEGGARLLDRRLRHRHRSHSRSRWSRRRSTSRRAPPPGCRRIPPRTASRW